MLRITVIEIELLGETLETCQETSIKERVYFGRFCSNNILAKDQIVPAIAKKLIHNVLRYMTWHIEFHGFKAEASFKIVGSKLLLHFGVTDIGGETLSQLPERFRRLIE